MAESRTDEVLRKHKEYIWPSITNYYQKPLVADHGSMQYLWDVEGNKYLDFFGGIVTIGVFVMNMQAVQGSLALQPVISGRYRDEFERVDGAWRFATRKMYVDLVGDLSQHLLFEL